MSQPDSQQPATRAASPSRERSLVSSLSIVGGVRSSLALSGTGLSFLRGATSSLSQGTRRALQPGRNETFAAAMARLGILEADLPLVHNQLLLSIYAVLAVALLALGVAVVYAVGGRWVPAIASGVVGCACVAFAAQASYRASCVRQRELGNWAAWLEQPSQWLPRPLTGLRAMNVGDPVVEPGSLNAMAQRSRRRFACAAGFAALTALSLWLAPSASLASGATMFGLAAVVALAFALQGSFMVFRGREQRYYDMLAWVGRPRCWIPAYLNAPDLAQRERALARQRHAQRVAARAQADEAREA